MRLAVLGVGLIGGSVALGARERLGAEVVGWDPSDAALSAALARGALDRAAGDVGAAVADAHAVVVAAPVAVLSELAGAALAAAGPECLVTDVGSTKRAIVAAHPDPRFVGGHPLAGAETAGIERARADLFEGATWYVVARPGTPDALARRLEGIVRGLGARPAAIDADAHDRVMASVSHLPHVLANVLVAQAAATLSAEGVETLPVAGPSFRDATRVAGAPSTIWTDIYLTNRDALVEALEATIARLSEARSLLAEGHAEAIAAWNDAAAGQRRALHPDPTGAPR